MVGTVARLLAPHRIMGVAIAWARLQVWGARVICGIRFQVVGELPAGAALIASHHESAFDTLVWMTLVPRPAYVMKQEMLRIPLFGALTRPAGMIAVDRGGGAKAMRGLVRDAARAVAEGRQIIIFPEGTRAESRNALCCLFNRALPRSPHRPGCRSSRWRPTPVDTGAGGHSASIRGLSESCCCRRSRPAPGERTCCGSWRQRCDAMCGSWNDVAVSGSRRPIAKAWGEG